MFTMLLSEDESSELSCIKCNNSIIDDNYIVCDGLCKSAFHVECSELKKNIAKSIKTYSSIKWLCQVCNKTESISTLNIQRVVENLLNTKFHELFAKFEQEKQKLFDAVAINVSEKTHVNSSVQKMGTKKSEDMDKLQKPLNSIYIDNKPADKSYSTVTKTKTVKPENSLFIKAKDSSVQTPMELCNKIKTSINPSKLAISVNNIKTTNYGVVINCKNPDSVNKLKDSLSSHLDNSCEMSTSKKLTPKIIIYGTEKTDLDDTTLANEIIAANNISLNQDEFEFKIVRKINHENLVHLIVSLDKQTRADIIEREYLYVGWSKCRIKDSYHVKICNTCCGFGHLSNNCKSKFPVCNICAESHEYSLCTSKVKKCANCIRFNKNSKTPIGINHSAKDKNCSSYLYKLDMIKNQTSFSTVD